MIKPNRLTPNQAFQKIKQYCSYQERCHSEVKDKLYSYSVYGRDADEIISKLIDENYLNEERFAIQFAGGKFRMKQWGRVKIKYELKQRQVSDYCIRKALKDISDEDYMATFFKLYEAKLKTLKSEKNIFTRKKKLQDYLMAKGYEASLISSNL